MHHFDVIIVGAGISGIGAAYHLQDKCPGKTYTILEGREVIGGTWDLFRYPGIRSDSDMHTLGYNFKPWREAKAIADGPAIRKYVKETADDNGITPHIRFKHSVKTAAWSTAESLWTVDAETGDTGERVQFTCNFLFMCSGYYSYENGYLPEFEGIERYQGTLVHPQKWPEDLDYTGKHVVVIGSGATAMTLVPAMARDVAAITMLQRSPTYVVSAPAKDAIANFLRKILPENWAYGITRWKNVQFQRRAYNMTRSNPAKVKRKLLDMVRKELDSDLVDAHFTPSYNPWDQRLCLIPDSDLYNALNSGKASVVTDHIDCFTETGLKLKSGLELEADIIVTATGLDMMILGGARFTVDGKPVTFSDTYAYKGMMFSNVPNLAQTFGYINASWTLRADLTSEYVCRLINHMDDLGTSQCTARLREEDKGMQSRPWIVDFSAGYMERAMHLFPKQGDRDPWRNTQNYTLDKKIIRHAPLEDGALIFENPGAQSDKVEAPPVDSAIQRTAA